MASRVSEVFPEMPSLQSYAESGVAMRPTSTFALAGPGERGTNGPPLSSCSLKQSMGSLASLFDFDDDDQSWSRNCWDLKCPAVGAPPIRMSQSFVPAPTSIVPYSDAVPSDPCAEAAAMMSFDPLPREDCVPQYWENCGDEMTAPVLTLQRLCRMAASDYCPSSAKFNEGGPTCTFSS